MFREMDEVLGVKWSMRKRKAGEIHKRQNNVGLLNPTKHFGLCQWQTSSNTPQTFFMRNGDASVAFFTSESLIDSHDTVLISTDFSYIGYCQLY